MKNTMECKYQGYCSICNSTHLKLVLTLDNIAAGANAAYHTADEARRAPKGHLKLVQCQECGFMWNSAFDIKLIAYHNYAFSYKYSPAFQKYLDFLISYIQKNYQIRNAKIIEIGCGEAHTLYTIAKATDSKGIGYEPSFAKRNLKLPDDFNDYVKVISDYYNESALHKDVDLVLCRHVLEHVPKPLDFLQSINNTLRKGSKNPLIVFEVPALKASFSRKHFHQFIYEHCNYFSPKSLALLFERAGFKVREILPCFEKDSFQLIFAHLSQETIKPYAALKPELFTESFDKKQFQDAIQKLESFDVVAIWGAGNSSQVLYRLLQEFECRKIQYFIDINPEKQGNFMAVSGLPILSPQQAIEKGIDAVIVGNATFEMEIIKMIDMFRLPFKLIV